MTDLSVTSKGQVTIPKAVRQKLGIRAGSKVRFQLADDHAELFVAKPSSSAVKSAAGMFKHKGPAVPVDFDVASLLDPKRARRGSVR